MTDRWDGLDPDDDLRAMEKSTYATFIGREQRPVLLSLWQAGERADNMAFLRDHVPELADLYVEDLAIQFDDSLDLEEEGEDEDD
jgi:hypothetical protein